jgi:UDP:flavonoid glycosyltransferase YjiC (YdhE family)
MLVCCRQFFLVANLVFPTPCILMPQTYEQHDTMEKIF